MAAGSSKAANTLSTSYRQLSPTSLQPDPAWRKPPHEGTNIVINISSNNDSTGKGILIGMLSAFGSAALVVLVFAIFYFFRYTNRGRIFLDRIGRPGEYDDEQALAREEAEALEDMDEIQRLEYMRAKGMNIPSMARWMKTHANLGSRNSLYPGEPPGDHANGHLLISVPRYTGKRRVSLGIRAGAGDSELLRRSADGDRVFRFRMQRSEQLTHTQTERSVLLGSEDLR